MLRRAIAVTFAPRREWEAIARERPGALAVLVRYVLPLAAIPAVAWMIGLAVFGMELVLPGEPIAWPGPAAILHAGLATFLGSILSVALLAGAFALIAPMYGARRDWGGAWTVAAYGTTPVWLFGVVLVKPVLIVAMLAVLLHCAYLYHERASRVALRARERGARVRRDRSRAAVGRVHLGGRPPEQARRAVTQQFGRQCRWDPGP